MKKSLFVILSTLGLSACTFPQTTKMEPVGETQMQTAQPGATTPDAKEAAQKKAPNAS